MSSRVLPAKLGPAATPVMQELNSTAYAGGKRNLDCIAQIMPKFSKEMRNEIYGRFYNIFKKTIDPVQGEALLKASGDGNTFLNVLLEVKKDVTIANTALMMFKQGASEQDIREASAKLSRTGKERLGSLLQNSFGTSYKEAGSLALETAFERIYGKMDRPSHLERNLFVLNNIKNETKGLLAISKHYSYHLDETYHRDMRKIISKDFSKDNLNDVTVEEWKAAADKLSRHLEDANNPSVPKRSSEERLLLEIGTLATLAVLAEKGKLQTINIDTLVGDEVTANDLNAILQESGTSLKQADAALIQTAAERLKNRYRTEQQIYVLERIIQGNPDSQNALHSTSIDLLDATLIASEFSNVGYYRAKPEQVVEAAKRLLAQYQLETQGTTAKKAPVKAPEPAKDRLTTQIAILEAIIECNGRTHNKNVDKDADKTTLDDLDRICKAEFGICFAQTVDPTKYAQAAAILLKEYQAKGSSTSVKAPETAKDRLKTQSRVLDVLIGAKGDRGAVAKAKDDLDETTILDLDAILNMSFYSYASCDDFTLQYAAEKLLKRYRAERQIPVLENIIKQNGSTESQQALFPSTIDDLDVKLRAGEFIYVGYDSAGPTQVAKAAADLLEDYQNLVRAQGGQAEKPKSLSATEEKGQAELKSQIALLKKVIANEGDTSCLDSTSTTYRDLVAMVQKKCHKSMITRDNAANYTHKKIGAEALLKEYEDKVKN